MFASGGRVLQWIATRDASMKKVYMITIYVTSPKCHPPDGLFLSM